MSLKSLTSFYYNASHLPQKALHLKDPKFLAKKHTNYTFSFFSKCIITPKRYLGGRFYDVYQTENVVTSKGRFNWKWKNHAKLLSIISVEVLRPYHDYQKTA